MMNSDELFDTAGYAVCDMCGADGYERDMRRANGPDGTTILLCNDCVEIHFDIILLPEELS